MFVGFLDKAANKQKMKLG